MQYEREYKRVTQAIRRQRKYGYTISPELIPPKPSKMEKIKTEDVERLRNLTPKFIRENSYNAKEKIGDAEYRKDVTPSFHNPKQSKSSGAGGIKYKKSGAEKTKKHTKKKPSNKTKDEARIPPKESNLNTQIISDITELLNNFDPSVIIRDSVRARKMGVHATLSLMWEEVLSTEGEYEVAYRLEQDAEELRRITNRLLYDSGKGYSESFDMGRFGEIVFGRAFTQVESDYYSDYAYNVSIEKLGLF